MQVHSYSVTLSVLLSLLFSLNYVLYVRSISVKCLRGRMSVHEIKELLDK